MTTLFYLGAGEDIEPMFLGINDTYWIKTGGYIDFSKTQCETFNLLRSVKTYILVDVIPNRDFYTNDLDTFIHYYTILVIKQLRGTLVEDNRKEKYLYFKLENSSNLYYYYNTNLLFDQDPYVELRKEKYKDFESSSKLLKQLNEVDIVLIKGFYYDELDDDLGTVDKWKSLTPNATTLVANPRMNMKMMTLKN